MSYKTSPGADEAIMSLLQPDVLIPIQYFENVYKKSRLAPEQRLMWAILEDSIACFQKYAFARKGKEKILVSETEDWIAERNSDYIFAFENICEVLGLNAEYLRWGLTSWKERQFAKRHKVEVIKSFPVNRLTAEMNNGRRRIREATETYREKRAVGVR